MGLARVIAGVHWSIDILGGAIIGILSAWLVCKIFKNYYTKFQ
jgi:membrane-associated phospholipid phosphatase